MLLRAVAIVLIVLQLAACTTVVKVPPESYHGLDESGAYLVKTVDDDHYLASHLRVEGDSLLVQQLLESDEHRKTAAVPITIPLANVASIEKRNVAVIRTIIAVTAGTVVIVAIALFESSGDFFAD